MTSTPEVSAIVTFYNQAKYVEAALNSLLGKDANELQIIVTDDGSTDATRQRVELWQVKTGVGIVPVFLDDNIGLPAILNKASAEIRGEYFVVLNGDDMMEEGRLTAQAKCLRAAPAEVGVVYSDIAFVDEFGAKTGRISPSPEDAREDGDVLHRVVAGTFLGMGNLMVRRNVLETVGPWNENLLADDFDLILRIAAAGYHFRYCDAPALLYRKHGESMTDRHKARLARDRLTALTAQYGKTGRDDLIGRRIAEVATALARTDVDRSAARRALWTAARLHPRPWTLKELALSYLRGGMSSGRS